MRCSLNLATIKMICLYGVCISSPFPIVHMPSPRPPIGLSFFLYNCPFQVLLERQIETTITNIFFSLTRVLSSDTMAIRFVFHHFPLWNLHILIIIISTATFMQIIHVNLTQESPKLIDAGKALDMTYSVKWEPTNIMFAHRFDVYLDYPFFEHQVITRLLCY